MKNKRSDIIDVLLLGLMCFGAGASISCLIKGIQITNKDTWIYILIFMGYGLMHAYTDKIKTDRAEDFLIKMRKDYDAIT